MPRIAFLVTHQQFPSHPVKDPGGMAGEQFDHLKAAALRRGLECEPVFWDAAFLDWSSFDAVCVLMSWGYPEDTAAFLTALESAAAAGVPVVNGLATIRRNMDKSYLADLAARGAPVPATIMVPAATPEAIRDAFNTLGADELVVKPQIGGGAWRQQRVRRGEPLPPAESLPPAGALIQPFLPSVVADGEISLVYFGGRFSHALAKRPRPGDYRTQAQHGAIETALEPPASALEAAEKVLATEPGSPFVYGRVDLVRGPDDAWLLMELEVLEPYLYARFDGADGRLAADRFAGALADFLLGINPV